MRTASFFLIPIFGGFESYVFTKEKESAHFLETAAARPILERIKNSSSFDRLEINSTI